jgi:hypothetical protein
MQRLYDLVIGKNPQQLQLDFALWTRELVRQLIVREFGVRLSASAVGRLLHRLGLSPQRPLWRAWQADPEKVAAWKERDYPAIAKQAKKIGATVYFADEAGIRSDHHAGTTWGAIGTTPVVKTTGARFGLNMISAVTAKGLLRFSTFTGSLTADKFIEFCKRLIADTEGPVFLVVDGHPVHRSKKVTTSPPPPTGSCGCSNCPGTPRSSTPTSGCGRTSSTTASAARRSPDPTSSKRSPSPRSAACKRCRTSCAASSATRTSPTSAPFSSTY